MHPDWFLLSTKDLVLMHPDWSIKTRYSTLNVVQSHVSELFGIHISPPG